jgi:hypothetical protein
VKSGEISKLIIPACFLIDFREFEIFIDHFDYTCIKDSRKLLIRAPFKDFEKSIRLGYIRTEIQLFNDRGNPEGVASMEDVVEELNKIDSLIVFKLSETYNYPRYVVQIPEPLYDLLIEKFIKPDALFKEEVMYLSSIFKEQLLNPGDLDKIKIKKDLSLFDFMKIRRVFMLFYMLFAKEIYKREKVDTDLLLRSLIPVYPEDTFFKLMQKLLPTQKIDSFLDIVCWEPGLKVVFDLQYHSILYIDNFFLIPLSIFANSNSIRNLFASEYKVNNISLLKDGLTDRLVDKLDALLKEAKIEGFKSTSINGTDVDLFAFFENTLFVFECKHNLMPVNPFDLRTTYDYIKKAEIQLDKIVNAFNNGDLIKVLEKKHNIDLSGITTIQACIVLSNRLFNGNIFKYPVRNINEIDNVFNVGTIGTEHGTFWLWKDKKLTIDFLLEYFSLDNKLIELIYDSLSTKELIYKFGEFEINFETYSLEFSKAATKLKKYTDTLEKIEVPEM